jgi:hypothetical protein
MKNRCSSKQCCDNAYNTRTGVLFGIAVATLHIVHHALTNHVPESIEIHAVSEIVAGALGGAALFAAGSALCNWFNQPA